MSGSSHAISVSIDTNRLVDQHSFQRAPSGVPHGKFSRHIRVSDVINACHLRVSTLVMLI